MKLIRMMPKCRQINRRLQWTTNSEGSYFNLLGPDCLRQATNTIEAAHSSLKPVSFYRMKNGSRMNAVRGRDDLNLHNTRRGSTGTSILSSQRNDFNINLIIYMPNYGDPQYWEDRYKGSKGKLFEWLEDFDAIEGLFLSLLDQIPGLDKSSDGW